jgi:dTDP-4-dehydrorhamnose reductase
MSLVWGLTLNSYTTFFDVVYRTLQVNNEIKAFGDQYRHPIYGKDAAYNMLRIPIIYDENTIMNFCGNEYMSRYEMCVQMADVFGLNKALIKKIAAMKFPGIYA